MAYRTGADVYKRQISTSLKSRGALMSIPIEWIPAEPSLDAYGEVFSLSLIHI